MSTKQEKMEAFGQLLDILDELRVKCPWDRKQTNESLRTNTIEETYELCDAIMKDDNNNIKKELGDLLLHIVFYAKIGEEKEAFDIKDVCDSLCQKLIFRHPFLFGGETPEPETVRGLLLDEIARLKREGVDEELFTLCKNQLYGELVQDLENIEDVAGALASSFFRGRTPADEIETLASVTLSDVNGALRAMLCTERSATVIIRPAQ